MQNTPCLRNQNVLLLNMSFNLKQMTLRFIYHQCRFHYRMDHKQATAKSGPSAQRAVNIFLQWSNFLFTSQYLFCFLLDLNYLHVGDNLWRHNKVIMRLYIYMLYQKCLIYHKILQHPSITLSFNGPSGACRAGVFAKVQSPSWLH